MRGKACCDAAKIDLTSRVMRQCGCMQYLHSIEHPHPCHSAFECDCEGFTDKSPWIGVMKELETRDDPPAS